MHSDIVASPARGYTPTELAKLLRVSADKIRRWIASAEMGAVNVASSRCRRPQYIVLPHHLAEWEKRRSAAPQPKPKRRKRQSHLTDFYPD